VEEAGVALQVVSMEELKRRSGGGAGPAQLGSVVPHADRYAPKRLDRDRL